MGESAGSWSVMHQIMNPLSSGLFIGAIGQSATSLGNLNFRYRTPEEDEKWAIRYFKHIQCNISIIND